MIWFCLPASASVFANSDAPERAADAAAGWCWCCLFAVHGRCWCSDAAERKTHMHPQLSPTKDTIITADILMAMMRCEEACMLYASLCCRHTHHITRFALLNVFCCKQLNFSWTTTNLWKGVETLDKCNSYSLKIPLKPKLCDEEKVKQAWNVFGFKMEISELAFVWTWFCFKVVYFHAFKELSWTWIRFFTHFVFASKKAISDEIWWCIEHLESQIKWDFLNNI